MECDYITETVLIRVKIDILLSVDQHKAIVLLDLSVAFDTVDRRVLYIIIINNNIRNLSQDCIADIWQWESGSWLCYVSYRLL